MQRSETFGQETKYSVTTPDGVARMYSMTYKPNPSSRSTPDRAVSKTSNRLSPPGLDSGYRSRSNISQARANSSQIPAASTPTCFGFSKKAKATANPKDAYVYMDSLENKAIILDNGKPFVIPVNIRGKYSIINTSSRLSITVLKEKFGKRARSIPPKENLTIEKKTCNKSTCNAGIENICCTDQTDDKAKSNQKGKKIPNPVCNAGKGVCYCKKCKI